MGDHGASVAVPLDRQRQIDLVDGRKLAALEVTIIGAGGIGSPTAVLLAKMGVERITVWDDDVVEAHNPASQWYRTTDNGRKKVEALRDIIRDFSGIEIRAVPLRYEGQEPLRGIVIAAVDAIDTRTRIWEDQVRDNPAVRLYIEGRMGGETFQIFAVRPCDPDHQERYRQELFPKELTTELPCTARAIIFNTTAIGAEICHLVKREVMLGAGGHTLPFQVFRDFVTDSYLVG